MNPFEYRPLAPEEHQHYLEADSQAFGGPAVGPIDPHEAAELRILRVDGRTVAQGHLRRLRVMHGSGDLTCGGMGSLSVPPEHRRRGSMERLLHSMVDELLEQKLGLCLLYPFKASFYQRYGWARAAERKIYSGSPDLLSHFRHHDGAFSPVGPEHIAELNVVYTGALRGRFGPVVRDEHWWREQVLSHFGKTVHAYLWRDTKGTPRSYVIYRVEKTNQGEMQMNCREAVALDPQARTQLFAFMRDHDSQVQQIRFPAPPDAPVQLLMRDELECTVEPMFMLRILDVPLALEQIIYPADMSGRCTLAISDDWLARNRGVFELEISGGVGRCRRLSEDAPADLRCDIRTLARIYTRYARARTASAFGLLDVRSRPALFLLDQLFAGLAPFCADFF